MIAFKLSDDSIVSYEVSKIKQNILTNPNITITSETFIHYAKPLVSPVSKLPLVTIPIGQCRN